MTAGKLVELLSKLPKDMEIFVADNVSLAEDRDISLEPVTESCNSKVATAYVLCDKTTRKNFTIEVSDDF